MLRCSKHDEKALWHGSNDAEVYLGTEEIHGGFDPRIALLL